MNALEPLLAQTTPMLPPHFWRHVVAALVIVALLYGAYFFIVRMLTGLWERGRLSDHTLAILRRVCLWSAIVVGTFLVLGQFGLMEGAWTTLTAASGILLRLTNLGRKRMVPRCSIGPCFAFVVVAVFQSGRAQEPPSQLSNDRATAGRSGEQAFRARVYGMLIGSAIGDAVGGPVEFQQPDKTEGLVPGCRAWPKDRQISTDDLRQFAASLRLHSYAILRSAPEPYGQWATDALPGTVTDDTRLKIVLMNALEEAQRNHRLPIGRRDLAQAFLDFPTSRAATRQANVEQLCNESLAEFSQCARWVLGSRDPQLAAPPQRMWGGVPTCCGQMVLLPLAAIYADRPNHAYRAAYELGFFDSGIAKDINSALVAGLSRAIQLDTPSSAEERRAAWREIVATMKQTDPYRYGEIPFVTRPTDQWIDFATQAVARSDRRPARLYEVLEQEGEVRYYWESHFVLAEALAMIEFCDYEPLAAFQLVVDFGHDSDSAAQLVGAFAGALHGPQVFPASMRQQVEERLQADYGQSVDDWAETLVALRTRAKHQPVVRTDVDRHRGDATNDAR